MRHIYIEAFTRLDNRCAQTRPKTRVLVVGMSEVNVLLTSDRFQHFCVTNGRIEGPVVKSNDTAVVIDGWYVKWSFFCAFLLLDRQVQGRMDKNRQTHSTVTSDRFQHSGPHNFTNSACFSIQFFFKPIYVQSLICLTGRYVHIRSSFGLQRHFGRRKLPFC